MLDELTLNEHAQIEMRLQRFIAAWKAGHPESLEQCLEGLEADSPFRNAMLAELLGQELRFRSQRGDQPTIADYRDRFPNDQGLITQAFERELSQRSGLQSDSEVASREVPSSSLSDDTQFYGGPLDKSDGPAPPKKYGRYRVLRKLGDGGFGRVYLAEDPELKRQVAIKVLRHGLLKTEEAVQRFHKEAQTHAKLSKHPHVVTVLDQGRSNGNVYLVMDYIDGHPLDAQEMASREDYIASAKLISEIADAIHCAHNLGITHRDLKPGNILLDSCGVPFVADFGLAVLESEQEAHDGEVSGTLPYMSPEQMRGEVHGLDGRTDIWGLGVIFYELLVGRRPFQGTTRKSLERAIVNHDPRPPRMIKDRIPIALERICLRALEKRPADRYNTAKDLSDDLRQAIAQLTSAQSSDDRKSPPPPSPPSPPPILSLPSPASLRPPPWRRGLPHTMVSAILVVMLASALAVYYTWRPSPILTIPPPLADYTFTRLVTQQTLQHDADVVFVVMAQDTLVTGDRNGIVWASRWRESNVTTRFPLPSFPRPLRDLAVSHDGRLVAVICGDTPAVRMFEIGDEQPRERPAAFAVQNPARLIASSSKGGSIWLVQAAADELSFRFHDLALTQAPDANQVPDDGSTLQYLEAAASATRQGVAFSGASGPKWKLAFFPAFSTTFEAPGPICNLALSTNGMRFAFGAYANDAGGSGIQYFDGQQMHSLDTAQGPAFYHRVAFARNDDVLLGVSQSNADSACLLRAWDISSRPGAPRLLKHEITKFQAKPTCAAIGNVDNQTLIFLVSGKVLSVWQFASNSPDQNRGNE